MRAAVVVVAVIAGCGVPAGHGTDAGLGRDGAPAHDGGLDAEVASDAGALDAADCQPGPFQTDFTIVPPWAMPYISGAASVSVGQGKETVDLGMSAVASVAGIVSTTFTLSAMRIAIDAQLVTSSSPNARVYMCMSDCNTAPIEAMVVQGGNLRVEAASQGGLIASRAYDPALDRRWQVREQGGVVVWETSPDGVTWNPVASYPTPAVAQTAQLWFGAWNNGDATGGRVTYSQFQSCRIP